MLYHFAVAYTNTVGNSLLSEPLVSAEFCVGLGVCLCLSTPSSCTPFHCIDHPVPVGAPGALLSRVGSFTAHASHQTQHSPLLSCNATRCIKSSTPPTGLTPFYATLFVPYSPLTSIQDVKGTFPFHWSFVTLAHKLESGSCITHLSRQFFECHCRNIKQQSGLTSMTIYIC